MPPGEEDGLLGMDAPRSQLDVRARVHGLHQAEHVITLLPEVDDQGDYVRLRGENFGVRNLECLGLPLAGLEHPEHGIGIPGETAEWEGCRPAGDLDQFELKAPGSLPAVPRNGVLDFRLQELAYLGIMQDIPGRGPAVQITGHGGVWPLEVQGHQPFLLAPW